MTTKLTPNVELVAIKDRGKAFGLTCDAMFRHGHCTIAEIAQMAACSKRKVRKAIERATAP